MEPNQISYCNTTGCRIAFVVKELMKTLIRRFRNEEIEMTIEQYYVLNILDSHDGLILQEVADIADRDKSAVLRHVNGLEKNHFITRVTDSEDKRRKLLLVTKRGMQALEEARSIDRQLNREITAQFEEMDLSEFEHTLLQIYDYLARQNS